MKAPRVHIGTVLICALLPLWMGLARAQERWLGAKRCASCHQEEYAAWKAGPHSRAGDALQSGEKRVRCFLCHGTGEIAGTQFVPGVECEACHGAGGHYAPADIMQNPELARALGLRPLSTEAARREVCLDCHRSTLNLQNHSSKAFSVRKAWYSLPHSAKKANPQ